MKMERRILVLLAVAFFGGAVRAQEQMPVPGGSFEQWTTHAGYGISVFGFSLPLFDSYATPAGWEYLSYPIDESISVLGFPVTVSTNIPLVVSSPDSAAVPAGSYAARLETFMLEDIIDGTIYPLIESSVDSVITQTAIPSVLSIGTISPGQLYSILNDVFPYRNDAAALLASLSAVNVGGIVTGGMALEGFEPTRLTGSYRYQSGTGSDSGAVLLLGTRYDTAQQRRVVVGGGIAGDLTDIANYAPFEVNYLSMHDVDTAFPQLAADTLVIMVVSSASSGMQQGSVLWVDNLVLHHDSIAPPDTCAGIRSLTAVPGIRRAVLNWTVTDVVDGYELEYGTAGFVQGGGTGQVLDNNTCVLPDLIPNTAYDVYLRSLCRDSVYGDWHTLRFVTLPDTCADVVGLHVDRSTYVDFPQPVLRWQEDEQPLFWEVEYGRQGFSPGQGCVSVTPVAYFEVSDILNGLEPNAWYDFYVRSVCADSVYGAWAFVQYLTPCASVQEIEILSDGLTVNADGLVEGYGVTWRDSTGTAQWQVAVDTVPPTGDIPSGILGTVDTPAMTLPALSPDKVYYVSVTPFCGAENYGRTEWVSFTTRGLGIAECGGLAFDVYPNPAQGSCTVALPDGAHAAVELYSLDGQLLRTISVERGSLRLDLPEPGMFLIRVTTHSGTAVRKIVSL